MSFGEILRVSQDYCDFDLESSPARARIYIKATRMMLQLAMRRSGQASRHEEIEVEPEVLERQLRHAESWLSNYNAAAAAPNQYVPAADWRSE